MHLAINLSDLGRQRNLQDDLARSDVMTDSTIDIDLELPFGREQFVNWIRAHDAEKDVHWQSTLKLAMLSTGNAKQKKASAWNRKWRRQASQLENEIRISKSKTITNPNIRRLSRLNHLITKTPICQLWNSHFDIRIERSKCKEWP
jgi:hypothetical protein